MSITGPYIPRQGDIIWMEFFPQTGNEINKRRPALVLSNYWFNRKTNFAFVVPITKTRRDHFIARRGKTRLLQEGEMKAAPVHVSSRAGA
nr:type II toxin-antitoxin system PemK/MazF family toxin [Hydrogenibacillus schlegelii]